MQNPDDKHIMDRVRSTLEEYQPQCSPESWAKMSALLDQQVPAPVSTNWRVWFNGFISGLIISIVFISSYFIIFRSNTGTGEVVNVKVISKEEDKLVLSYKKPIGNYQSLSKPRTELKIKSNFNILINNSILSTLNNSNLTRYDHYELGLGERSFVKRVMGLEGDESLGRFNEQKNDSLGSNAQPLVPMEISTSYFSRKPIIEKIKPILPVASLERREEKSRKGIFNWGKFDFSFKLQDDLYKNFVGPDKIRLGYSPELVHGKFQDKSGISHGAGFELEGPISKRVMAGVGFNLRKYEWSKEQKFDSIHKIVQSDTAFYQYVVDSIHQRRGKWQFFEVPISLKLNFMEIGKSKIYFNTYLAAIFMQSESYEFNRIIKTDKFSQRSEPKPFSNINVFGDIRIGLEYRYAINRRWNFYFEPYYKWHLNGLGVTGFKPQGLGINFGLIYQFNLHGY